MGIGPIFFYVLAFPIYMVIHWLSQKICKSVKVLESFNKAKAHKVTMLNFLFGACFELNITACISTAKLEIEDFRSFWEAVSMLLALVTLGILAVTPWIVFQASKRYYANPAGQDPNEKLFLDKREESLSALNYQSFYLIRRYLVTATLVFLWDPVY